MKLGWMGLLALVACQQTTFPRGVELNGHPEERAMASVPAVKCQVYDACTGRADECVSQDYFQSNSPQVPVGYFEGAPCLTVKEDFTRTKEALVVIQGPGPLAIPELGI